ncbi:MAG TPA: hypothetical protein DD723_00445 [Candidatus Omnitrophica bacterium]|nr:MAG: hypothetical protein A2Z81_03045 [Omnitrophica WOR_2 bacterium GWA2_45_18]HBR14000.1 hypothetical protein [Candidatus Omnitrophota bacterium]
MKLFPHTFLKNPRTIKKIFVFLTLLCGSVYFAPTTDFAGLLAQGDHGRDFYAFERTLKGDVPFRDYWWVYGPLMPYYYSLFFKWLGVSIPSILIGRIILTLFSGVLIFLSLAEVTSVLRAFLAALCFYMFFPDFYFTYNHTGAITAMTALFYGVTCYLNRRQDRYLVMALGAVSVTGLIKINFGLASLVFLVLAVAWIDRVDQRPWNANKKIFYIAAVAGVPLFIGGVYSLFLRGLPVYVIKQSLPFWGQHLYNIPLTKAVGNLCLFLWMNYTDGLLGMLSTAWFLTLTAVAIYWVVFNKAVLPEHRAVMFLAGLTAIFAVLNLHEYLPNGIMYRLFWMLPWGMVLIFLLWHLGEMGMPSWTKPVGYLLIFGIIIVGYRNHERELQIYKQPEHFVSHPKARVYVQNTPAWIETVLQTSRFLEKVPEKTFFAAPYEPLYYYLTSRKSPVQLLSYFEYIYIPEEQEREVISELEKQNVRWVLLSNRIVGNEAGLGLFGSTHCRLLASYIQEHFKVVATSGNWAHPAGWAWQHAIMILKRP